MSATTKKTLTVSLTPQQAARLHAAIESGDYASDTEIVRDALQLWEQREDNRLQDLDRLRQAYTEGKASGEAQPVDRAAFFKELKAERRDRG